MSKKTYKYKLVVEFESEKPLKMNDQELIQFENGLPYFADTKDKSTTLNSTYVYGSGKMTFTEIKSKKK